MDPQHTGDLVAHLEKQNELLKETQKTMTQELQKLEVEEQMMMHKLYELMTNHRLNKKKMEETKNVLDGNETCEASSDKHEGLHPPVIYTYHRRKKKSGRTDGNDA